MSTDNEELKAMAEEMNEKLDVQEKFETEVDSQTEEYIDDSFVDDGDSLIGEKYKAPEKDQKFVDVHKGTIVDKKDVSPLMQIKAFHESNGIKIGEPKSGCRKCYGRGYTGFEIMTKTWIPCGCLFPAQTKVQRDAEEHRMITEGKLNNTPANRRMLRRMQKKAYNKLIHKKYLELLKNPNPSPKIEEEVANG